MDYFTFLWCFCLHPPARFALLWIFLCAYLSVLNTGRPPFASPAFPSHVQKECSHTNTGVPSPDTFVNKRSQLLSFPSAPLPTQCLCTQTGERSNRILTYTRDQLLSCPSAPLTTDLTVRLRLFGVGSNLPRKRTRRGGRRKQRKSADTCTTHLRQHWSTSLPPSLAPDSSSPPSSPLTRSSSSPPLTSSTPLASLSPPSSSPQRLLPYPQPALTFTSSPPSPPVSPVPPTLPSCLSHPQPPLSPTSPRPSSSPVTPTLPSCLSHPQPPLSPTSPRPSSSPVAPTLPSCLSHPQPPLSPTSPRPSSSPVTPTLPSCPSHPQPPLSPTSPRPSSSPVLPTLPSCLSHPQPPLSPTSPRPSSSPVTPTLPSCLSHPQPPLSPTSPRPSSSPVTPTLPSCLSHPQPPLSPTSPRPSSSPVTPTLPSCPSPSPYPQPPPSPTSYGPPSSSPSPCDTLSRSMQPPTCDPVFRDSPSLPLFSSSFFSKSHNVHNENHNVSIEPSSPILHPICNPNKLKMCLFNAQSVCKDGKADAIADFIHNGQVDIAFITETWLNCVGHEPIEKCLTPTDYRLASFPRPTLGGGIAILYKDSLHPLLSFSQSLPFSHSSFEHVQVCFQSTPHPITFSCVYRPPPSSTNKLTTRMFLSEFDQLLDHYSLLPGNLIVLGDINIHYDNPDSYDTKHICSSLSHRNMTQHISEPTQQAGHILDWIMSRQHANPATGNSLILSTSLTSALPSDHSAILCSLDISPPTRTKHTVTRRNLKSINLDTFSSDASRLLSEKSQNLTEHFDTTLRHLLDTHAPVTTRHLPNRPPAPWLTPEIAHAKRARRRAERRWRKTKLTVHKQIFHTARRRVSTLISSAKNTYFQNKIITSSSSKQLFTTMNHLLGTQKNSPLPTTHSHEELPTVFSNYFTTKIQTLRENLDTTPCQPCPPDPPFSGSSLRTFTPISQEELLKTIRSMSLKTCELDPLPASLYSDCLPALLPSITDIINTSLKSGTVPDSFKSAIVRPLLKKHNLDPNELKNYRPISNLCFLSKLLEKVVLNQLNLHLSTNNLLNPFQSAYRQSHSTETALLHILNDLLLATDSGKVSLLTLLDLSAAFDTIDHTILLTRLQHTFGISDTALSWFSSYLSDRKQTVLINGIYSQSAHLTCGVPQGSVLGPVLFTLYASPLSTIIESHSLKHHFYADDTQLQDSASPENIQTLLTRTSECYSDVKNWMTNNKLKLNDDKTEAILISTRQKLSQLPPLSLQLCNTTIPISESAKNLGVHLDSTLCMQNFVSQTAKSCYYHLRRISLIRKHLTTEATVKLVLCLIMSRIDYCNSLLSGVNQSYIYTLQRIQNNAARLILKKKKTDHISPLLTQLHWLPVQKRILYKLDTICYKCLNNAAPDYLTSLLSSYKPSRTLRSASDPLTLKTPRTKLNSFGPRAFSVSGPLSWNNLPLSVRQQPTFSSFKTSLKTHLFSSP